LRDYHAVSYVNVTPGYTPPTNAVLLINQSSIFNVDTAGFSQTRFIHRWWFPETYRGLTLSRIGTILTSRHDLNGLWHFFLYRRQADPYSSVSAVALFPESLAAFDVRRNLTTAVGPIAQPDGRIVVGGPGAGHGQFDQPAGLFVDSASNIWVADSKNGRIQKFDAQGNYVGGIDRSAAQLNEPWSLAVDRDGTVFVADTWNHRILVFSAALSFVGTWGVPAINPNPNEFELFGPREIAFAPDGSLWVSDTGNKRLINYAKDGKALGTFGSAGSGPGQFNEQVGIAFDRAGNLYVADTWNGRIQKLGSGMAPIGQFPAPWTSQGVVDKPYLAVLDDGRIVASDPGNGDLLLYASTGAQGGKWHPGGISKPLGLAAWPGGGFAFTDAGTNQLQIVPATAIAGLFH
jgi:DNA-binding beta-propeller fold protein YncE